MKSIEFESAQNVKVEYELASVGQRTVAAMLDVIAFFIYFLVFSLILGLSSPFGMDAEGAGKTMFVYLLLIKIPWIFYNPLIEYITQGQSLGKYIMGIRVVTISGERPGLREVFTRWIFKGDFIWISADPFTILIWIAIGLVGILFAGTSERRQRMGDAMAGTIVIRNKSSMRYTLRDVLSIKSQDNHTPTYINATRFTDEDMLLIKNTIQRVRLNPNPETKKFAIELADESARLLGLEETPKKRLQFLQTLLQDYVVLTR
ncbi:MAG: RDD family protein [Flavobacteriales bacterium]|nr:RDD family protein [Flavobacteriales bacterium]